MHWSLGVVVQFVTMSQLGHKLSGGLQAQQQYKTVSRNFWLKIIRKENGREKPKKFASLLPEGFWTLNHYIIQEHVQAKNALELAQVLCSRGPTLPFQNQGSNCSQTMTKALHRSGHPARLCWVSFPSAFTYLGCHFVFSISRTTTK